MYKGKYETAHAFCIINPTQNTLKQIMISHLFMGKIKETIQMRNQQPKETDRNWEK